MLLPSLGAEEISPGKSAVNLILQWQWRLPAPYLETDKYEIGRNTVLCNAKGSYKCS